MAKYLGGTDSQQEEVKAELITPGLLNNDFVLNVSTGIFAASNPAYQALAVQAGVNLANVSWGSFVMGNLLPVTLGNILGGLAISFIFWYCYGKK